MREGSDGKRGRDTKSILPGFLVAFAACESPLTGEEYRASSTNKRGALEVMNQYGDKICPDEAVPRVVDSFSRG